MGVTRGRILLVDDEPQVRLFVKALLSSAAFDAAEAKDGIEALHVIEDANGAFDLLITDIKMPRMDGFTLANSVARNYPSIPILFISGYSGTPDARDCAGVRKWAFLGKPFTSKTLMAAIDELLRTDATASAGAV